GLPAETPDEIEASMEKLESITGAQDLPSLLTFDQGETIDLSGHFRPGARWTLVLEDGQRKDGVLAGDGHLPAIDVPGYHQLAVDDASVTLAIAPPRCPTVQEIAGEGAWGLTVQLYCLRRPGDFGIGDTQALEELA